MPQAVVLLGINYLSGIGKRVIGKDGQAYLESSGCKELNCGISHLGQDLQFTATFTLSVCSSVFGVTRFLKNGPMTLVLRTQYGVSFFVAMFCISLMMIGKGCIFGLLLLFTTQLDQSVGSSLGIFVASCVLPHLILVSVYRIVSIRYQQNQNQQITLLHYSHYFLYFLKYHICRLLF